MPPDGQRVGPSISIVVPVLDEAEGIGHFLDALQHVRGHGVEIVVVDGGSRDATIDLARPRVDQVVRSARGRSVQMNAGARASTGEVLLFLHADTRLPRGGLDRVRGVIRQGACWGRFDVSIEGRHPMLTVIGTMMNLRSRLSGVATGDQAIFVTRAAYDTVGGFAEIALMEDLALSDALLRVSRPVCLRERVTTSGRRWETNGVWGTIFLMWRLRAAYRLGASSAELARQYHARRNRP